MVLFAGAEYCSVDRELDELLMTVSRAFFIVELFGSLLDVVVVVLALTDPVGLDELAGTG